MRQHWLSIVNYYNFLEQPQALVSEHEELEPVRALGKVSQKRDYNATAEQDCHKESHVEYGIINSLFILNDFLHSGGDRRLCKLLLRLLLPALKADH